jgi:hypothetical protein
MLVLKRVGLQQMKQQQVRRVVDEDVAPAD